MDPWIAAMGGRQKSSSGVKWLTVQWPSLVQCRAIRTEEGSMQDATMIARTWPRDAVAAAITPSLECVSLFSLIGVVASAAVLLTSSAQTVASVTAALM
jgi:hypothetical protein